jgi:hypothetical protein
MLIGVIYWAVNCPICNGWDYYGLEWFSDRKALIVWLAEKGKSEFFVKDVWDSETHKKLDLQIEYAPSHHCYVGAEVYEKGIKLAFLKQDPYDAKKPWVIEELDEAIELGEL